MAFVYRYKTYNILTDSLELSNYFATEKFIKETDGAQMLIETKTEVDDSLIDGDGRVLLSI